MGHSNHRTLILLQMLLQPVDAFCIQVVRGLVEQQHVGFLQKQSAQGHTTALTARECFHTPVAWRTVQRSHRTVELRVHVPGIRRVDDILQLCLALHQLVHLICVLIILRKTELHVDLIIFCKRIIHMLNPFHHVLLDRLLFIQWRVLGQIAHRIARTPHYLSLELLIETGNNLHKCGLTRTVQTNNANLRAVEETQIDVL